MTFLFLILGLVALVSGVMGVVLLVQGATETQIKLWLTTVASAVVMVAITDSTAVRVVWALAGLVAAAIAYIQWHATETERMNPTPGQEN